MKPDSPSERSRGAGLFYLRALFQLKLLNIFVSLLFLEFNAAVIANPNASRGIIKDEGIFFFFFRN